MFFKRKKCGKSKKGLFWYRFHSLKRQFLWVFSFYLLKYLTISPLKSYCMFLSFWTFWLLYQFVKYRFFTKNIEVKVKIMQSMAKQIDWRKMKQNMDFGHIFLNNIRKYVNLSAWRVISGDIFFFPYRIMRSKYDRMNSKRYRAKKRYNMEDQIILISFFDQIQQFHFVIS